MDFVAWCGRFLGAVRRLQDAAPAGGPGHGPDLDEVKEALFGPEADRPGFWQTSRATAIRAAMAELEALRLLERARSDAGSIHVRIPNEKRALLEDLAGLPVVMTRDVPRLKAKDLQILRVINALSERQEVDHAFLQPVGIPDAARAIASEFGYDIADPNTKRWGGEKIRELEKPGLVGNTTHVSGNTYFIYGDLSVFQATYRGLALGLPPESGARAAADADAPGGDPSHGSPAPAEPGSGEAAAGTRRLKVFLCHSSGDKDIVRTLYSRLQKDGVAPWLDEEDLLPGQNWELEIQKAVHDADVVLVCLSRASVEKKSGYLQKEIAFVLDRAEEQAAGTIYVIPLRLEECDVPERLQVWHRFDYFKEGRYERLLAALDARAREVGAALPTPT